jgi:hypothetical protein
VNFTNKTYGNVGVGRCIDVSKNEKTLWSIHSTSVKEGDSRNPRWPTFQDLSTGPQGQTPRLRNVRLGHFPYVPNKESVLAKYREIYYMVWEEAK